MASQRVVVYTDGSCVGNGYHGARAGAGVYFGEDDPRNLACGVPGLQTNNRGEVFAILKALEREPVAPLDILTDSQWAINCITRKWKATANLDMLKQVWTALEGRDVVFTWVRGHAKNPGNEAADELARQGASITENGS